ncbi:MAG TPA: anhydro-N-acetylmuramic acid kinase, partial [Bacteroidales bacterium]|nr:anhydro-N-acetylmuramic acid kinase [Bacteroidales bacterium]
DYGQFLGVTVSNFVCQHQLKPDFVSSHGHTLFHQPEIGFTLQIGDGQSLADCCGFKVINDFRSEDVAKGGQGAPLVPIGDQLLFSDYDCLLNIGGIANLSVEQKGIRLAYDICIANQALNYIAGFKGLEIDYNGELAASGKLIDELYEELEKLTYFQMRAPKSLGREFFENKQKPLLTKKQYQPADLAHTFVQHIVSRISLELNSLQAKRVLITGGGALNEYLVKKLRQTSEAEIIVPDERLVNYKEALIFAFLGVLKIRGEVNVLASVTGAESDSCSGKIWYPSLE